MNKATTVGWDRGATDTVWSELDAMKKALKAIAKEAHKGRPDPDVIYRLATEALEKPE